LKAQQLHLVKPFREVNLQKLKHVPLVIHEDNAQFLRARYGGSFTHGGRTSFLTPDKILRGGRTNCNPVPSATGILRWPGMLFGKTSSLVTGWTEAMQAARILLKERVYISQPKPTAVSG
jgi:hypothetical protein